MKKHFSFILVSFLFVISISAQKNETFIPASSELFKYIGRVQIQNEEVKYNWPGVSINANFEGNTIGIKIEGGGSNYFNVWIDENPAWVLHAPVDSIYFYPQKLHGSKHHLTIVKRTEADMGMVKFSGIITEKSVSSFKHEQEKTRKLLFIGNSITCGYGTEGKNKNEHFNPSTENCEQSYATILSRAFNADYQLISHSGLGIVRNYGDSLKVSIKTKPMPARLDYLFDNDPLVKYDMLSFIPDAIVINLGTNDFSTQPYPDKSSFKEAYQNLIARLHDLYSEAPIFCITGPMINEPCFYYVKSVADKFNTQGKAVYFIGVPNQLLNQTCDLGSDWHPSFRGQLKSAKHLIGIISNIKKWDFDEKKLNLNDKYFSE